MFLLDPAPQPKHVPTTQTLSEHKEPNFEPISVMNASMNLKEKFEALMKNCEAIKATNEELMNQNAYLKRPLEDSTKQKKKAIASSHSSSPPDSAKKKKAKRTAILLLLLVKRSLKED